MKRFMIFSVSILCLSISAFIGFYIGSQKIRDQRKEGNEGKKYIVPYIPYRYPETKTREENISNAKYFYAHEGDIDYFVAILPNGDVYRYTGQDNGWHGYTFKQTTSYKLGNFWSGIYPL